MSVSCTYTRVALVSLHPSSLVCLCSFFRDVKTWRHDRTSPKGFCVSSCRRNRGLYERQTAKAVVLEGEMITVEWEISYRCLLLIRLFRNSDMPWLRPAELIRCRIHEVKGTNPLLHLTPTSSCFAYPRRNGSSCPACSAAWSCSFWFCSWSVGSSSTRVSWHAGEVRVWLYQALLHGK